MRERRGRVGEMFVPLSHGPGHAQCDFGEAVPVIAGVERRLHYFLLDLPRSDDCFAKAYPGETTEAFLDGHASAFAFWAGRPKAFCTTIPSSGCPGYSGPVGAKVPKLSPGGSPIICSKAGSVLLARGMTRPMWRR